MKAPIEKHLPEKAGWKCFLETANTLLKKNSLIEQSDFFIGSITEIFGFKCQYWFAHPFYPLPGEDNPALVNMSSDLDPLVMDTYSDHLPRFQSNLGTILTTISSDSQIFKASIPLISGNDLLGILLVETSDSKELEHRKLEDLSALASLCAMSFQIYRLNILKSWRLEQLSIVREVSDQIATITNLDKLCEKVATAIQVKFQYYYVAIFTYRNETELVCRSCASMCKPNIAHPLEIRVKTGQGIIGWVAEHKNELFVEDVTNHPIYRYHESLPETRSEVALPLIIGERVLGVLDVQSNKPHSFHEMDLVVLRTLADNIAIAIEGAHLFSGLSRRTEQISTVYEISHSLSSILDLDLLLDKVVHTIQEKFNYLQVNIYTVHSGREKIIFRTGTGENIQEYQDAFLTFDINYDEGILPRVAREGKTIISNDVLHDPQYRFPDFVTSKARSEMSVPLITGGEITGILDIQSDQPGAFDENDRLLFEALSPGIATSIRNATLFRSEQFRRQVAESVRDVAGILSGESSVEELMDRILEKLQDSLPCDVASIWLTPIDTYSDRFLNLAAIRGAGTQKLKAAYQTADTAGHWIIEALNTGETRIRSINDPRGPLGEAMDFSNDYSAIAAPLRAGGVTVGLLTLAHHQPDRYGTEARLITQTFAGYAAAAIQNSRLYASMREQAWVSTVLLKVAETSKKVRTQSELAETIVNLIPELIGCSNCALYVFNASMNMLERKATCGFSSDALPAKAFSSNHPAFVFASRMTDPVPAYQTNGDFVLSPSKDASAGVVLALKNHEQILGLLWVGNENRDGAFSNDTLQVLKGIGNQTATAWENLRLLENQQQDAFIAAALLQVAQTVAGKDDLRSVLDGILGLLPILAGINTAAFFCLTRTGKVFLRFHPALDLMPMPAGHLEPAFSPMTFPCWTW